MNLEWVAAIGGAFIGGCIAGLFSLLAIRNSFKYQQQHADENEKKLIKGVLQAIHDEVEIIWTVYQEAMGERIEALKEDEPLNYYYPVVSDFLTMYSGNSFLIGRIPDNDLRKQIIMTYTLAKALIDSFQFNNDLVSKFEVASKIHDETNQDIHKRHAIAQFAGLISYAKALKEAHQDFKAAANKLLRDLRKHGVLNEKGN